VVAFELHGAASQADDSIELRRTSHQYYSVNSGS